MDHPILGGYVMGVCAAIIMTCLPRNPERVFIPACLAFLALLAGMALTQSRGVLLALIATCIVLPLSRPSKASYLTAGALLLGALIGFFVFEALVTSRGLSYRPGIFVESARMIMDSPLTGIGATSSYLIFLESEPREDFAHAHNLFLHVGIESGLPGLILFMGIWLYMGYDAWRHRHTGLGGILFVVWVYSTVAITTDVASLWPPPPEQPGWSHGSPLGYG